MRRPLFRAAEICPGPFSEARASANVVPPMSPPVRATAWLVVFGAVVVAILLGATRLPRRDHVADLFDDSTFHRMELWMQPQDWRTLVDNYADNDYYRADLVWKGHVVHGIGLRSRGGGSRNALKPGLLLRLDRYEPPRTLFGLRDIVLDNLYQDFAMIRERVTMKFYERMGLPAPREVFTKLFVNGEDMGVYAIVEAVDEQFLARVGLDRRGYLYEYKWDGPWLFEYLGADFAAYENLLEPRTHRKATDATLFRPVERFVRTVNDAQDAEREIGAFLDIGAFLRTLAVEAFLADWDGLAGQFGTNNFYLYRPRDSLQFRFLPWDKDNTFKNVTYPVWPDGMDQNRLIHKLMSVPTLREEFFRAVLACADAADAPTAEVRADGARLSWLRREIERQHAQIVDAARADAKKLGTTGAFDAGIEALRVFARDRGAFVRTEVEVLRRTPPKPLAESTAINVFVAKKRPQGDRRQDRRQDERR